MVLGKPVDHILTVPYVHTRICCLASTEVHRRRLLDGILVGAQAPRGRVLRAGLLARKWRSVEAVCPQRLVGEINSCNVRHAFAGRRSGLGRRLRGLDGLWRDKSMDVVISGNGGSQRGARDTQEEANDLAPPSGSPYYPGARRTEIT